MKSNLRYLTEALASVLARTKVDIRKILTNTYLMGSSKPEDYGPLSYTGDLPDRIPQAYDSSLDKLGDVFAVKRLYKENDTSYRQRIIFSIKKNTTNSGIEEVVKFIFEKSPFFNNTRSKYRTSFSVRVLENYEHVFDGVSKPLNTPLRGDLTRYYGITVYVKPQALVDSLGNKYPIISSYDFNEIIKNSDFDGFREMFGELVASGIKVDRVILEQPGAGGNKAELYSYA